MNQERETYRSAWEAIESGNPALWHEFASNDVDAMIDELVRYKKRHYPDDCRRILVCGMVAPGNIHVEWLEPAAPGVDPVWEMHLFGLVRTGRLAEAMNFLQETRRLSREEAATKIAAIAADFALDEV